MAKFTDEEFSGNQNIDGNAYEGCTFNEAVLIYSGGNVPSFSGCQFDKTTFQFDSAAANTVAFMKSMAHPDSGQQLIIRQTFGEIFPATN